MFTITTRFFTSQPPTSPPPFRMTRIQRIAEQLQKLLLFGQKINCFVTNFPITKLPFIYTFFEFRLFSHCTRNKLLKTINSQNLKDLIL